MTATTSPEADTLDARHRLAVLPDGAIDVTILGMWSRDDVDRFFAELLPLHAAARRRGAVRVLITVSRVQSPLVALHVRERALALKRPGDRNAVVVASFLSRLQITRLAGSEGFGLFTDRDTALAWLADTSTAGRAAAA